MSVEGKWIEPYQNIPDTDLRFSSRHFGAVSSMSAVVIGLDSQSRRSAPRASARFPRGELEAELSAATGGPSQKGAGLFDGLFGDSNPFAATCTLG